ncbi:hypothetical protein CSUI_000688 [Cystoisospora suis]|uniref:Uncharacterized protein n=1 Tax=Cystoisospora suis TaxID=483139 RepID=A0A2C6LF63_9APIC|nr:hypothetical protein CSUI_000688 [Cystoisospora suis]
MVWPRVSSTPVFRKVLSTLSCRCAASSSKDALIQSTVYIPLDSHSHLSVIVPYSSLYICRYDAVTARFARSGRLRSRPSAEYRRLHSEALLFSDTVIDKSLTGLPASSLPSSSHSCTSTSHLTGRASKHAPLSTVGRYSACQGRALHGFSGKGKPAVSSRDSPTKQRRAFASSVVREARVSQCGSDSVNRGPVQPLAAVSPETLAGIPWMSRGRLCSIVEEVTERGPYDVTTWNKLLCRAEAISGSLSARDIGRLVVCMAKVNYFQPSLLSKLARQVLQGINDADGLTCSGLLHGFSRLNRFDAKLFHAASRRLQETGVMRQCSLFSLSLALSACLRHKFVDEGLFVAAGNHMAELLPTCNAADQQSVALLLNCFARLFNMQQRRQATEEDLQLVPLRTSSGLSEPSSLEKAERESVVNFQDILTNICAALPPLLPKMNLQSLTLVLNALSRLRSFRCTPAEVLAAVCDLIEAQAKRLSALQALTVLNALVKLRASSETELLEAVLLQLRDRAHHLNPRDICLTIKCLTALRMKDQRLEEELEGQIFLTLHHFSPEEVTALTVACSRWTDAPSRLRQFLAEKSRENKGADCGD